jgi:hypothetical protein
MSHAAAEAEGKIQALHTALTCLDAAAGIFRGAGERRLLLILWEKTECVEKLRALEPVPAETLRGLFEESLAAARQAGHGEAADYLQQKLSSL